MAKRNSVHFQCHPTELQKGVINFFRTYSISVLEGEAGTAKDFCSMYFALNEFFHGNAECEQILVTKPLVEVGRGVGFLPGPICEKTAPYEDSISSNVIKLIGEQGHRALVNSKKLEFVPINYVRGDTFENSIIILTEAQNCTLHELITFVTRVADSSRLLINGDTLQSDIKNSGFATFITLMQEVEEMGFMRLDERYQMRSELIVKINRVYREYMRSHVIH